MNYIQKQLDSLVKKRDNLESRLYAEKLKSNAKFNNLGFGYGMRSYHSLKTMSFKKEDNLKERLETVKESIDYFQNLLKNNY